MGSRVGSHQLRNGLYVSGRPEKHNERQNTVALKAVPYTGGDVTSSGELGKMYGLDFSSSSSSTPQHNSGSIRSGSDPNSGNLGHKFKKSSSGSIRSDPNSGNLGHKFKKSSSSSSSSGLIQPTGLLTSGPIGRFSGKLEASAMAVTRLSSEVELGLRVSRVVIWVFAAAVMVALVAAAAVLLVAVEKKAVIVLSIAGIAALIFGFLVWNLGFKRRGFVGFVNGYADSELRGAIDGQLVKVTGVATCGSIPLETSFQKIQRCVYVSTELYEYKHRFFSWGQRHSEKYVADFYVSDFQSGLRALVKAGYGAKVAPFVTPSTVVDTTKNNSELSPDFVKWLADRKLSSDDKCSMRLKEGYIKEGSTVSVMGVVRRHDNVLMIVPPKEPVSTRHHWTRCLLPTYVQGLVLTCDDNHNTDVVPV